jgi:MFS family permease
MAGMTDRVTRRQLVRAAVASSIGTTIEWYDTILYALVVGLYLGHAFFPGHDPFLTGLASLGSLVVGFLARPLGSLIFGHFGDRLGRKSTLIATLLVTGFCSVGIGVLPSYAQIGILAPILLISLRILMGLALGGEWGGSVLLALEWGNRYKRGFWSSWPQIGLPAGTVLGLAALRVASLIFGPQSDWVWRAPFLFGIVLIVIGLYVRLGILETPTFAQLLESRMVERRPAFTLLRKHWREILVTCLLQTSWFVPNVLVAAFVITYTTVVLHLPVAQISIYLLTATLISVPANLLFGYLSDLIGRKPMYMLGILAMFVLAWPFWMMLNSRSMGAILLALTLNQVIVAMMTGPMAAMTAEAFTGRIRYSGASLGAGLAAITAGGPAPVIALSLLQRFHTTDAIAVYVMVCCVVAFIATLMLKDRSKQDLTVEYDLDETVSVPVQAAVRG